MVCTHSAREQVSCKNTLLLSRAQARLGIIKVSSEIVFLNATLCKPVPQFKAVTKRTPPSQYNFK